MKYTFSKETVCLYIYIQKFIHICIYRHIYIVNMHIIRVYAHVCVFVCLCISDIQVIIRTFLSLILTLQIQKYFLDPVVLEADP